MRHPVTGEAFTDDGAWAFIAEKIESHQALKIVELDAPPGTQGFEMIVQMGAGLPNLYIKLAVSRTGKCVIGRSFHYSDR